VKQPCRRGQRPVPSSAIASLADDVDVAAAVGEDSAAANGGAFHGLVLLCWWLHVGSVGYEVGVGDKGDKRDKRVRARVSRGGSVPFVTYLGGSCIAATAGGRQFAWGCPPGSGNRD
jgi:hypothetical protein